MPQIESGPPASSRGWGYVLLALAVLALGAAGYAGFLVYPRLDIPAGVGVGLLVLAVGAGVAAFFAPCSFPLLVSLLARGTGVGEGRGRHPPLAFAGALSVGVTLFLVGLGAGIAFGGAALFGSVTFDSTGGRTIRIVLGTVLVVLGTMQSGLLPSPSLGAVDLATKKLMHRQAKLRGRHPTLAFGLFGFLYPIAGFG